MGGLLKIFDVPIPGRCLRRAETLQHALGQGSAPTKPSKGISTAHGKKVEKISTVSSVLADLHFLALLPSLTLNIEPVMWKSSTSYLRLALSAAVGISSEWYSTSRSVPSLAPARSTLTSPSCPITNSRGSYGPIHTDTVSPVRRISSRKVLRFLPLGVNVPIRKTRFDGTSPLFGH